MKKKVILSLTFMLTSLSSFAKNHHEMSEITIDSSPTKLFDMENNIPFSLVSLGASQPAFGIIVEKESHILYVFKLNSSGGYEVVDKFLAITGKSKGDKQNRGDNKTPEGIYFVTGTFNEEEIKNKYGALGKKYGSYAFTLDYPNIYDKRLRKTGSGIWIHGVYDNKRIDNVYDTEGCVALKNEDVLHLKKYISLYTTPIVIVDKIQTFPSFVMQELKDKAISALRDWKNGWESSNFETYLSYYSQDFHSNGKNKEQWKAYKSTLSNLRRGEIEVNISEPKVIAFKNQLFFEFLQEYKSPGKVDFGRKYLYMQKEDDGYKIIAEKWYPLPNNPEHLALLKRDKRDQAVVATEKKVSSTN